jgi:hypothetical protein
LNGRPFAAEPHRIYLATPDNSSGREYFPQNRLKVKNIVTDYIGLAMTYTSLLNAVYSINEIIQTGLPVNVAPRIKKT